jgi:hypothetical protein
MFAKRRVCDSVGRLWRLSHLSPCRQAPILPKKEQLTLVQGKSELEVYREIERAFDM